jgi:amidase
MNELIHTSATALARAIRAKEVSAAEVVQAYIQRIEAVNPQLNAVVQLRAEAAQAEARAADAALARGQIIGPLHGVPMTIKDSLDTAGVITTGGTKGRATFVPAQDATVVARLRAAGAILLGKTNTPELTLAGETDNLIYGRTNNPYDLARTPGGSSGGAAAIVAAGGAPFDIGSDTAASIRWPAHCCGIAGIKPTAGRVPRTGHIIPFGLGARDMLTQNGPMARFVEDLSLILPIICGPDWQDPAIIPMPLGDPAAVELKQLRVAVHTDNGILPPTASIRDAVRTAAQALADAGVAVGEVCPRALERVHALSAALAAADGRAWVQRLLANAGTTEVHPWLAANISQSQDMSVAAFTELLEDIDQFRSEMLAFMEHYDVILSPVNALPALPHDTWREAFGKGAFSYTQAYNLTGWPGAVVRGGTSPEGVPIGVQVVAHPWREDVALAVGQYLEGVLGGWQRPPL